MHSNVFMVAGEDERDRNKEKQAESPVPATPSKTSRRGFASMSKEKQREIARKGGRAAHLKGTAHEFTSDEARAAGRKGGETVSRDRNHMAEIGREGGQARSARLQKRANGESSAPVVTPSPVVPEKK